MTEWFYVLTLQWPNHSTGTRFGTITTPGPGSTRGQIFNDVFEGFASEMPRPFGVSGQPNVMFWSLEPNDLT